MRQRRQQADVARAGLVVDDADDHERHRLEQGVGDEQDDPRLRRRCRPGAEQHDEEAELAHRAVGEEQLEVVLAQRAQPSGDHRDEADREDERAPRRHQGEHRREAAEQVDAGLHHRRRVEVGAHRRRRRHRPRQPRVERVLRRLGERPDRDAHQPDRHRRARRRVGEDRRHAVRARRLADEDEAGEHHEPAGRGDQQRLQRGGAGRRAVRAGLRSADTDAIDVSSHAVNSVIRSSATTMPSIAPANRVSSPASRSVLSTSVHPPSVRAIVCRGEVPP